MLHIAQIVTPADIERARELIREYTSWAFATQGDGVKDAPTFAGLDAELATLPGIFAPPDGRLLLARLDGRAAGCIALRRHDATSGEVKRLYVRTDCRGHRVGERLVASLLDCAREIGYRRLVLDSHRSMTPAHALYRAAGFRDVPPPPGFPEDLAPIVVFMEMDLR